MANEYLKRTPTSSGNRSVFTWSGWVKKTENSGGFGRFFESGAIGNRTYFTYTDLDEPRFTEQASNSNRDSLVSNYKLRDSSSICHVMIAVNSTLSNEDDRVKIYINGSSINNHGFSTDDPPALNALFQHNEAGEVQYIGNSANQAADFQGYMSDVFHVDGQALTPDVFGFYKDGDGYQSSGTTQATDFRPGQWTPHSPTKIKKDINRRGGFGANGFYLPMNDSSNPGADFHCAPNSIITLKGEDLPQPRNGAPTTSDAYVSELRSDPFAANLVYALPLISGGTNSGFGDYSADIKGSGTNKTVTAVTYNGITPTITSGHSAYGSFADYNSPANTGGYINVADSTAFDNVNLTTAEWTFEAWFKRGAIGSGASNIIQFGNTTDYQNIGISIHPSGTLYYVWSYNGSSWGVLDSTGGPVITQDEWCHIAIVKEATPTPRIVTYVNGVAAKSVSVTSNISYTSPDYMRIGGHYRGPSSGGDTYYYNGGIFDARFYSTVKYKGGFDVSKPYTPVGIEAFRTTADTCKNNFATLNPIDNNSGVLSNGNLTYGDAGSDGWNNSRATIGASSGKWYWEMRVDAFNQVICASVAGPAGNDSTNGARLGQLSGQNDDAGVTYYGNGRLYHADSQTSGQVSWGAAYGASDVIGIALDMDDSGGKVWFSKNGSWQASGNPSTGANAARSDLKTYADTYFPISGTYFANTTQTFNFGQNPTFSGQVTAGTNADGNGKGLFKYAPPSGFLALCEDNLPTPAIADPGKHFKSVLYTGDGNEGHSITGFGFKPDLVWIKCRSHADNHTLSDTVRGPGLALYSDLTNQEHASNIRIQSFNDDGFTTGSSGDTNTNGRTFCAWCWKAGGPAVSNSDGSITSQVSANQTAGFSIVSYTGNGNTNQTVGHGLNKKPSLVIYKDRDSTSEWRVIPIFMNDGYYLSLSTTAGRITSSTSYFGTNSSSVLGITGSNSGIINANTKKIIAYCWAEIEGYSKFGSYVGNGSADGPFIYCGFKPAFVIMKRTSSTGNWVIHDNARNPTNPAKGYLLSNSSGTEQTSNDILDLCSNGFKIRNSWTDINSGTHIFMAFAESPFQTANAK